MGKKRSVPLYDAAHPLRVAAIQIIEDIIEPLLRKGLRGTRYYETEDAITSIIHRAVKPRYRLR